MEIATNMSGLWCRSNIPKKRKIQKIQAYKYKTMLITLQSLWEIHPYPVSTLMSQFNYTMSSVFVIPRRNVASI